MPSDEQISLALDLLADPIEKYRSAVVSAAEEVREFLRTHQQDDGGRETAVAAGLGPFASGRIDLGRFRKLVTDLEEDEDPDTLRRVENAFELLRSLASSETRAFYLRMIPGAHIGDAVAGRLSEIGRGFGAARVAGLAVLGALRNGNADGLLGPLGFGGWNSGERQLAPPLVVELEGSDLHAAELAEFLDGGVKIILLVNGDAPPAPLVRLITPRTFVLQAHEAGDFDRFRICQPPAIAAWMPESAARFVHDPARGDRISERLTILHLPDSPPQKKLGGISARQQQEELDQLCALARAPESVAAGSSSAAPGVEMTSVDKLAAWLLLQTDLSEPG